MKVGLSSMKATALLLELLREGVRLWVEGDGLRFRAAKGVLATVLYGELSRRERGWKYCPTKTRGGCSSAGYRASGDVGGRASAASHRVAQHRGGKERTWTNEKTSPATRSW